MQQVTICYGSCSTLINIGNSKSVTVESIESSTKVRNCKGVKAVWYYGMRWIKDLPRLKDDMEEWGDVGVTKWAYLSGKYSPLSERVSFEGSDVVSELKKLFNTLSGLRYLPSAYQVSSSMFDQNRMIQNSKKSERFNPSNIISWWTSVSYLWRRKPYRKYFYLYRLRLQSFVQGVLLFYNWSMQSPYEYI